MNFNQIIRESILAEATGEAIYTGNNFAKYMDRKTFDTIVGADPTSVKTSPSDITKVGQYSRIVLAIYKNEKFDLSNLTDIYKKLAIVDAKKTLLSKIEDNSTVKSIQDIKTIEQLNTIASALALMDTTSQTRAKTQSASTDTGDYNILFEDATWEVVEPRSYEASVKYGQKCGGRWCTTSRTERKHYDMYMAMGDLVMFYNKKNPKDSYYLAVNHREFNDVDNNNHFDIQYKSGAFVKRWPQLAKVFEHVEEEANKQKKDINYFISQRFELFKKHANLQALFVVLLHEGLKVKERIAWLNQFANASTDLDWGRPFVVGHRGAEGNPVPVYSTLISTYTKGIDRSSKSASDFSEVIGIIAKASKKVSPFDLINLIQYEKQFLMVLPKIDKKKIDYVCNMTDFEYVKDSSEAIDYVTKGTLLQLAISSNAEDLLGAIVEIGGANPNLNKNPISNLPIQSPLDVCIIKNKPDCFRQLYSRLGADLLQPTIIENSKDGKQITCINKAVQYRNTEILKEILGTGVDPNFYIKGEAYPAIFDSIIVGDMKCFNILLAAGAKVVFSDDPANVKTGALTMAIRLNKREPFAKAIYATGKIGRELLKNTYLWVEQTFSGEARAKREAILKNLK